MDRKTFLLFLFFVLLVVILRLPSFDIPLDADSGANAFFARQMIRGETLYDKFHPTHHLPGIYYTFVAAFKIFGDNPAAPNLLLLPFMIASVWLIYLMGRSLYGNFTGLLSACLFALIASQSYLDGMTVQMELFANLPLIGAMFLLVILLRRNAPAEHFIWVGMLCAICILYKVVFVAPLAAAGISIFLAFWTERQQSGAGRRLFFRWTWLAVGVILPLACVALYFASLGLWDRFLLIFILGSHYFGDQETLGNLNFPRPFGFPLFMLAWNNVVLLIFGLLGAYRLLRRSFLVHNGDNVTDIAVVVWFIISLALTGLRGAGYPHYILTTLPPLALVAAAEIHLNYERWKTTSNAMRARLSAGLMIGLVIALFFVSNNNLYRAYFPYKMGQISYEEFCEQISSFAIDDIRPVADYIKTHTDPDDFIYAWSKSVQVYYFADRLPPVDIIWTPYISAINSPERIFEEHTKYIIVDSVDGYPRPQWFTDGLSRDYVLEIIIDDKYLFHRRNP